MRVDKRALYNTMSDDMKQQLGITKCIAPNCVDGKVYGEVCRACMGVGYIYIDLTKETK